MGLATQSVEKKTREIAAVSEKLKKTKLSFSDLVIPIASGILFLVLAFAVFIPMITSAFEYLDEIEVTEGKIEQLEKLDKQLKAIDENQLNEDVLVARQVIPRILKVSDFIYYVDTLAGENRLEITELSAGDTGNSTSSSGTGVTGPVAYQGEYIDVINFLDDVQNVSPYIIRLQNVEVSRKRNSTVWSITLQLSGYYLLEGEKEPSIYSPFQPYTEYDDIVEIFKKKAEQI